MTNLSMVRWDPPPRSRRSGHLEGVRRPVRSQHVSHAEPGRGVKGRTITDLPANLYDRARELVMHPLSIAVPGETNRRCSLTSGGKGCGQHSGWAVRSSELGKTDCFSVLYSPVVDQVRSSGRVGSMSLLLVPGLASDVNDCRANVSAWAKAVEASGRAGTTSPR